MEESTSFLAAFLLPFHVMGGAALGIALRRVVQDGFKLKSLAANGFLAIWGSMFGGIPLIFGLTTGVGWFFPLQVVTLLGALVGVAMFYEWLRDLYRHPGMFLASFGLIFFVVGLALAVELTPTDADGLLFGLIFGGIGGVVALIGVWMLLRSS